MGVEMRYFYISKTEDGNIEGSFMLIELYNIYVEFYKKDKIYTFEPAIEKEKKHLFYQWFEDKKQMYEEYIENHLDIIDKLDNQQIFDGEIVKEEKNLFNTDSYNVYINFENIPFTIRFSFFLSKNYYEINTSSFFPINSQGEVHDNEIYLKYLLKEETIKHMWEPFRSKTKYRLELLHILR